MKIFACLCLAFSFAFSVSAQKRMQVIVTSTFLRKAPNPIAEKLQTLAKGDALTLEKSRDVNGWYYVSAANGAVKGWIRKDTIGAASDAETVFQRPKRVAAVSAAPPPATAASAKPTAEIVPPAAAAKPADEEEVIRIDTEEVSLNVRVVDANNRAVKNLKPSQFKIYEDDVLQTITSLAATEVPMINALVIDNSRSLRTQLKSIIEAGKIIVATNRPADETAIVRFTSADKIEIVQDFTQSKSSLGDGLDNLFVEGGQTALVDAIYTAAEKIERYRNAAQTTDDIRIRALILVSDGDDRASTRDEQQLFELLRKSQVQIYAVGFVNNLSKTPDANGVNRHEKAKSFLTRLTEETGGRAFFPASIGELPQIAADISAELHAQYSITYTPTNERRDGTFRRLKVEIEPDEKSEKRIAVARTGRISAKN